MGFGCSLKIDTIGNVATAIATPNKRKLKLDSLKFSNETEEIADRVLEDYKKLLAENGGQLRRRKKQPMTDEQWVEEAKKQIKSGRQEKKDLKPSPTNQVRQAKRNALKEEELDEKFLKEYLAQVKRDNPTDKNGNRIARAKNLKTAEEWLEYCRRPDEPKPNSRSDIESNNSVTAAENIDFSLNSPGNIQNLAKTAAQEVANHFFGKCVPNELTQELSPQSLKRLQEELNDEIQELLRNRLNWALNSVRVENKSK